MSKFLEAAFAAQSEGGASTEGATTEGTTTEETTTTEGATTEGSTTEGVTTTEGTTTEGVTTTEVGATTEGSTTEGATTSVPEKKKVVIDLNDYLTSHEDTVLQVLREKKTDYSAITNEDALKLKLQKENPEWDVNDILSELQDRYGIGQEKITIDLTEMDAEEVKTAEAHNRKVDAANRLLKKEGKLAKEELAEAVKGLKLPELEYEVEASEPIDVDAAFAAKIQEYEDGIAQTRTEVWIPALTEAIKTVDKITEEVTYEADGVASTLKVEVALTKEEKDSILAELSNYQATGNDEQYMTGDVMDYTRFIQDKTEVLQRKKVYAAVAKQAAEKATQDYIRNNVVNYSSGVRNTATSSNETTDVAVGIWKNNKNNRG